MDSRATCIGMTLWEDINLHLSEGAGGVIHCFTKSLEASLLGMNGYLLLVQDRLMG